MPAALMAAAPDRRSLARPAPRARWVRLFTYDRGAAAAAAAPEGLVCPYGHTLHFRVGCWAEYGFLCLQPDRRCAGARCRAQMWLLSLPEHLYALIEITPSEFRAMEAQRMSRDEQIAYLWRPTD